MSAVFPLESSAVKHLRRKMEKLCISKPRKVGNLRVAQLRFHSPDLCNPRDSHDV